MLPQRAVRAESTGVFHLLLLGGVRLKVPGLSIGIDLAMLLKDSSVVCGCSEVLADDRVNSVAQVLVVRISPVNATQFESSY